MSKVAGRENIAKTNTENENESRDKIRNNIEEPVSELLEKLNIILKKNKRTTKT